MLTLERVAGLYREYRDDLAWARDEQRALLAARPAMRAQLDDVEAEITYLLLRGHRPASVVELGSLHGWSTTWILRALRDNGRGALRSYDLHDACLRAVPAELAHGRWRFTAGDVRVAGDGVVDGAGYLFVDADHGARFARWYVATLLPALPAATPVSVHDVFHRRWATPLAEGSVVLRRLAARRVGHFTASRARAPDVYRALAALKAELGLAEPIRRGRNNPMIFFATP